MAPAGDAKPAICSEDASDDGIFLYEMFQLLLLILDPVVSPERPLHPFDVLRKTSIQFEPYVMFVQVCKH